MICTAQFPFHVSVLDHPMAEWRSRSDLLTDAQPLEESHPFSCFPLCQCVSVNTCKCSCCFEIIPWLIWCCILFVWHSFTLSIQETNPFFCCYYRYDVGSSSHVLPGPWLYAYISWLIPVYLCIIVVLSYDLSSSPGNGVELFSILTLLIFGM